MLTVGDIMTRDVITVSKETPIRELAELFTRHRIGSIPVVNGEGNLEGIVTETDLVEQDKSLHIPTVISIFDWVIYLESEKKFERELKKITGQTVGDIFTESVETVSPGDPVSAAADIMAGRRVNAVPVTEGKKVAGIISRIDLIRSMSR
jgi:CBS domain-containing protein